MDLLVVLVTELSLFFVVPLCSCRLGELELPASSLLGKFIRVLVAQVSSSFSLVRSLGYLFLSSF